MLDRGIPVLNVIMCLLHSCAYNLDAIAIAYRLTIIFMYFLIRLKEVQIEIQLHDNIVCKLSKSRVNNCCFNGFDTYLGIVKGL